MRTLLTVLLGLFLLSSWAHAKIVFGSIRNGVDGIYVMDDDGSNQTLLIEDKDLKPHPNCWSPDGKQIVFDMRVKWNTEFELFIMNADGTDIRQLTDDGSQLGIPSISPDGTFLVFGRSVRVDNNTQFSITVLNIKTGKMKNISDTIGVNFDWSPDGKHIIYNKGVAIGRSATIWIIDADGHNPRPLIPVPDQQAENNIIYRSWPHWSPDGQQIVFQEEEYKWEFVPNLGFARIHKAYRVMICDRKGENIRKLQIPADWEIFGLEWMDDGKSIVFSAFKGMPLNKPLPRGFVLPPCNIYKYHIRTDVITRLTDHPGEDNVLDWISDDVLSVTPRGKKKVKWGRLKQ